jgi:hypothetical protein
VQGVGNLSQNRLKIFDRYRDCVDSGLRQRIAPLQLSARN